MNRKAFRHGHLWAVAVVGTAYLALNTVYVSIGQLGLTLAVATVRLILSLGASDRIRRVHAPN